MKNNYQKELSKYNISKNAKEKLYQKIERPLIKRFKFSYCLILIIIACIIPLGITYADDIKEYIIKHTNTKYKVTFADGTSFTTNGNIKLFKTKIDDYRLTEKEISLGSSIMPLKEIEEKLGMTFLSFNGDKNYKMTLGYDLIADKNHPETYGIIYGINIISDSYVVDHNTTSKNVDARIAVLSASFSTTNYLTVYPDEKQKEQTEELSMNEKYLGETYIENLDVKAYITDVPRIKEDKDIEYVLHFTYQDIPYELWSINLTMEELLAIANNLK